MPDFIERLVYGSAVDTSGLFSDADKIESRLDDMGEFAADTFQKQIARELAKSIDPKDLDQGIKRAQEKIKGFGKDAQKVFRQTLGREQAKRLFDPIRDESRTFFGQIKGSFREAFDIRKIAIGTAAGLGLAELFRGLTNVGREVVNIATDAEETRSKFDAVFKDMADDTREWANSFASSVGRARIDTEEWLATLQDTFVPLGFARDEAAKLSQNLVKLGVDVASFNNTADTKVIEDFQSAIVGNTETVRKYGIVILKTTIEQEALNQGINKSFAELTETEKAFLRYNIILKSTTDAQGDAVRTAESFANQQKRLDSNLKNLGENVGGIVIPALNSLVTSVNDMFESFGRTEIEKTIEEMQRLGASAEQITFTTLIKRLDTVTLETENLNEALEKTVNAARNAVTSLGSAGAGGRGTIIITEFNKGQREAIKLLGDQLDTEEKITNAKNKQAEVSAQIIKLSDQITKAEKGITELSEQELKSLRTRRENLRGQLQTFNSVITAQEQLNASIEKQESIQRRITLQNEFRKRTQQEIRDEANKALTEIERIEIDIAKAKENRDVNSEASLRDQLLIQKDIIATARQFVEIEDEKREKQTQTIAQRKEENKLLEQANKIIEDTKREIELLAAASDEDRAEIRIRQEADALRERVKGNKEALEQIAKLEQAQLDQLADERKKKEEEFRTEIDKTIEAQRQQLEILQQPTEIGKQLAGLRQRFAEERKLIKGTEAQRKEQIDIINKKERIEFEKTINEFEDGLTELQKKRLQELLIKLELSGEVDADLNKLIDVQGLLDAISKTEKDTRDAFMRLEDSLKKSGIDVGSAIDFVGVTFGDGAANLTADLVNFGSSLAATLASGNIFQQLSFGVTTLNRLFDSVFGSSVSQSERDAVNRFEAANEARRRAAEDTEKLATAISELNRSIKESSLTKLNEDLDDIRQQIDDLLGPLAGLSDAQLARIDDLLAERDELENLIRERQLDRLSTVELEQQLQAVLAELAELGADQKVLTEDEKERLALLRESAGLLEEQIASFGTFGDNFSGLMDRLNASFDLLDVKDPSAKIEAIINSINDEFGSGIEDVEDFISRGIDAFLEGGDTLKSFLDEFALGELTVEEFQSLISRLESLQDEIGDGVDGVEDELESFGDIFSKLLADLKFEFDLFDIEDPVLQLRKVLDGLTEQFGIVIEDIDDFVERGFAALRGRGEQSLNEFLQSLGFTGELTAEEFEDLLRELEALQDRVEQERGEVERIGGTDIGISAVKAITFEQGNRIANELSTIRVILTQSLDIWRSLNTGEPFGTATGDNQSSFFIVERGGTITQTDKTQLDPQEEILFDRAETLARSQGIL